MINFENVYYEVYIIIIMLAILFFLFSKVSIQHLIIIIILVLIAYALYFYLSTTSKDKDNSTIYVQNTLDNDIKDRVETNERIFYIDKFPKHLKFLKQNKRLIDIITNIRFIKQFNKTRYADILLNANKLMKIYMYILSERYDATYYLPVFTDIRDNIIELMHSLVIVIPEKLKHSYGIDTYTEIGRSISEFTDYSNEMLETLEKYSKIYAKKAYIPDSKWIAYNIAQERFYP